MMQSSKLPKTNDLIHGANQVQKHVNLVDGLIDQRSTTFSGPTSLDRTLIIRR
jgi:hypothetical protein